MKTIELTRGFKTVIDDNDWDLVKGYKWTALKSRNCSYAKATLSVDGKQHYVLMHRLLMGVSDRSVLVDHKDGDSLNNRRENLRLCTHAENMRNSKTRRHSSTQVRNVRVENKKSKYPYLRVRVVFNGVTHQKSFKMTEMEAATAYAADLRKRLHGEFDAAFGCGVV